jgi:hypothetical protein
MSRYEDRTDPWRVKALRHRIEHHNHINGVCDLINNPKNLGWKPDECYIDTNWYDPEMRCSCNLCSMGMKELGRKKRRAGKREARDWEDWY